MLPLSRRTSIKEPSPADRCRYMQITGKTARCRASLKTVMITLTAFAYFLLICVVTSRLPGTRATLKLLRVATTAAQAGASTGTRQTPTGNPCSSICQQWQHHRSTMTGMKSARTTRLSMLVRRTRAPFLMPSLTTQGAINIMKPQHTTPCAACPFSKTCKPGALGGSSPEVYIGQASGPFFLPCHSTHNYKDEADRRNHANPQCAGAAIFRTNAGVAEKMPKGLLRLPAGNPNVFGSFAEFVSHHMRTPLFLAEIFLRKYTPAFFLNREMQRQGVQKMPDMKHLPGKESNQDGK